MKWCLCLLLAVVLMLPGCAPTAEPKISPVIYETPMPPTVSDVVTVTDIIDRAAEENLPTDTMLEPFWSDGEYRYFFPTARSQYVTVFYSDGTQQTVVEALWQKKITIADLDAFGIDYHREPILRVMNIVDRAGRRLPVPPAGGL